MNIIQNKIFLNDKHEFHFIEKPISNSYYSFVQNYNRNGYFLLKYKARIIELELLMNDEEYRENTRIEIEEVNNNNEHFINFVKYLRDLYENQNEEINKLCIKYRENNELFKWYIYMNGLIEIESGKKENIIKDLRMVIIKNEKVCN